MTSKTTDTALGARSMDTNSRHQYTAYGYHIEHGLFSKEEAGQMREHYMALSAEGPHPGDFAGVATKSGAVDPQVKYPRLIQMHEYDEPSRLWMNAPRLADIVTALMGQKPRLLQTMVYFKPPGARGQSFHQDNLYLRVTPVVAAWVALDQADAENGAMEMVRGSHLLGLLPCREADTEVSFTDSETVLPDYLPRDLIALNPGDAVFFHGLTVHGSAPNNSTDRFRRAFICHYEGETTYKIVGPPLPTRNA
jgi:phytanoyl-CoA hydroxylase